MNKGHSKWIVVIAAVVCCAEVAAILFTVFKFHAVLPFALSALHAPNGERIYNHHERLSAPQERRWIVDEYLRSRPEMIEQALKSLETKRQAEEKH